MPSPAFDTSVAGGGRNTFVALKQVQNISQSELGEKSESFNEKNVNTHHSLTQHSHDYVSLRRLIRNNSSLSCLIASPSPNNKPNKQFGSDQTPC